MNDLLDLLRHIDRVREQRELVVGETLELVQHAAAAAERVARVAPNDTRALHTVTTQLAGMLELLVADLRELQQRHAAAVASGEMVCPGDRRDSDA